MPIKRPLKEANYKPEQVDRLNRAFCVDPRPPRPARSNDPICEIVARKIIEINAAGWHEPEEIAELAAAQLG